MENILSYIVGGAKVLVVFVLLVFLVPIGAIAKIVDPKHPFRLPIFIYGVLLRFMDINVRVTGTPSKATPTFFVSNHSSYIDILVLGSLLPASFVAKAEVAGWPLFGLLAKIQNTIFIERRTTRAIEQRDQLQKHLAQKQNIILFPEGTSSDGLTVLPFKSTLFSIIGDGTVNDNNITIQPVSVTCSALNGMPLLREERALYAWYGDMTLMPHLWQVLKRSGYTVDVVFHDAFSANQYQDRKALAATCQEIVGRGIEQSLARR